MPSPDRTCRILKHADAVGPQNKLAPLGSITSNRLDLSAHCRQLVVSSAFPSVESSALQRRPGNTLWSKDDEALIYALTSAGADLLLEPPKPTARRMLPQPVIIWGSTSRFRLIGIHPTGRCSMAESESWDDRNLPWLAWHNGSDFLDISQGDISMTHRATSLGRQLETPSCCVTPLGGLYILKTTT